MSKRNIKKIIIGLILIVGAIAAALVAFYYLEVKPTVEEENQQQIIPSPVAVVASKTPQEARMPDVNRKPAQKAVSNKVESPSVNIPREKKEGFLWADKKSSKFVITLGASQGIIIGDRLSVYDNGQKIGEVQVVDVYDAISYVNPLDIAPQSFQNDYYRAVRE